MNAPWPLITALLAIYAGTGLGLYVVGFALGVQRGRDLQRVDDITSQWIEADRRNRCGRFGHLRQVNAHMEVRS